MKRDHKASMSISWFCSSRTSKHPRPKAKKKASYGANTNDFFSSTSITSSTIWRSSLSSLSSWASGTSLKNVTNWTISRPFLMFCFWFAKFGPNKQLTYTKTRPIFVNKIGLERLEWKSNLRLKCFSFKILFWWKIRFAFPPPNLISRKESFLNTLWMMNGNTCILNVYHTQEVILYIKLTYPPSSSSLLLTSFREIETSSKTTNGLGEPSVGTAFSAKSWKVFLSS